MVAVVTKHDPEFFDRWLRSLYENGERPRYYNTPPEHPRLQELCDLLKTEHISDIEAIHRVHQEPREALHISKRGREYSIQIGPRVTWKSGYDFRTAAPYAIIWLDGEKVVYRWPRPGQSSHWLD